MAKEINAAPGKGQKRKTVDSDDEDDSRLESYLNVDHLIFFTKRNLTSEYFLVKKINTDSTESECSHCMRSY